MTNKELKIGDKIRLIKAMGRGLPIGSEFKVSNIDKEGVHFANLTGFGMETHDRFYETFEVVQPPTGEHVTNLMHLTQSTEELKVISNGKATIVILKDGTKGVSKCHDEDTFNKEFGLTIAYNRAKIKQLQKEIKYLATRE